MIKVSIIVPFFNEVAFLPRCLNSIQAQNFPEMEIILVDDGSTDGSGEIADAYAAKDGRILVIHQEQGGRPLARNTGLDAACGEYIQFVDADDYIHPEMTSTLVDIMQHEQPDLVFCGVERLALDKDGNGTRLSWCENPRTGHLPVAEYLSTYAGRYNLVPLGSLCNKLHRREIIEKRAIRFRKELLLGQDMYFSAEYLRGCRSVFVEPRCFYVYVTGVTAETLVSGDRYVPNLLWYRLTNLHALYETAVLFLSIDELHRLKGNFANLMIGGIVIHCRRDATLTREKIVADLTRLADMPMLQEWLTHCRPLPEHSKILPLLLRLRWVRLLFYMARRRADQRFGHVYGLSKAMPTGASV